MKNKALKAKLCEKLRTGDETNITYKKYKLLVERSSLK